MKPTNIDRLPPTRRACGNCGRLGHLTRTCTGTPKALDKIGVEIEGYWLRTAGTDSAGVARVSFTDVKVVAERWHMDGTSDGSLRSEGDYVPWEFRSRPGSLGEAISQVVAVYPHGTNQYAGMHVHVSFRYATDISWLSTPEFFRYFKQRWTAWGNRHEIHRESEFWKRLNGENDYCRPNEQFSVGRDITSHDRYRQLNFSAWRGHQTLECRLLPMFRDARLAVSAMEELVAIYEDYLQSVTQTLDYGTAFVLHTAPRAPLATVTADLLPSATTPGPVVTTAEMELHAPGYVDARTLTVEAPDYGPVPEGYRRIPEGDFNLHVQRAQQSAELALLEAAA